MVSQPCEKRDEMKMCMKVISSDCIVKSQQKDERDLTVEEKVDLLSNMLHGHPATFLARFGSLLDETDLSYFRRIPDYEVAIQVKELTKTASSVARRKQIRNRRYNYMRDLMQSTDYFSTQQMRERNPLLYEYYVGQYMTDDEKLTIEKSDPDMTLSEHIFFKMDRDRMEGVLYRQQLRESGQLEESDEDTTSGDEERDEGGYVGSFRLSRDPKKAGDEKQMLREEFLHEMQESFLSGSDQGIDYHSVDSNAQYDPLDLKGRDEEESYFDREEPCASRLVEDGDQENMGERAIGDANMEYDY